MIPGGDFPTPSAKKVSENLYFRSTAFQPLISSFPVSGAGIAEISVRTPPVAAPRHHLASDKEQWLAAQPRPLACTVRSVASATLPWGWDLVVEFAVQRSSEAPVLVLEDILVFRTILLNMSTL